MDIGDIFSRFWGELTGRLHGPMTFRFYLQPAMAAFAAWKSGTRDARRGNPPYFWSILNVPRHRTYLLREGWKDVSRIFFLGIAMDLVYQYAVLRGFRPLEALNMAFALAVVPYLVLRGIVTRIASARMHRRAARLAREEEKPPTRKSA